MISLDSSPAEPRVRTADRLWRASVTVLAAMPVGMAVAHRSSPVFLVLAAVLAAAAAGLEQGRVDVAGRLRMALGTSLGATALAFLAWTVLSVGWSAYPGASLRALGEFWVPVAAALVVGLLLPGRVPRWGWALLAGSIGLASLIILSELATDLALRRAVGVRSATFIFNRPVLTILVCLVPLLAVLPGGSQKRVATGVGVAGLALAATLASESGAATFGLAVGALTLAAALLIPAWIGAAAAAAVIAVFAAAPILGPTVDRLLPASAHERMAASHSRERLDIWMSFNAAIREQPILGGGFGVSPRMAETPVADLVPPQHRTMLAAGHPHNAAIQIWAELGVVGAALAAAVLILILRALGSLAPGLRAPALALFAAVATVSLVGHGAWQGWWAAAVGAAIVWFRALPVPNEKASR